MKFCGQAGYSVGRGPGRSDETIPVPDLHSATRKLTTKEQTESKVPPCMHAKDKNYAEDRAEISHPVEAKLKESRASSLSICGSAVSSAGPTIEITTGTGAQYIRTGRPVVDVFRRDLVRLASVQHLQG